MTRVDRIRLARQRSGATLPARPTWAARLQRFAPFVAVAAMAYPVLVWPLLEAQLVSLEPVYGQPPVDGPPSMLLRVYFSSLFLLSVSTFASQALTRPLRLKLPLLLVLATFIGWAGTTSLWAVAPEISARRFMLATFVATSIVGATLAGDDPKRTLRIAFWMFAVMTALSLFSLLTTAPTALGHAAFYPHKNYFAVIAAVMILFALYQVGEARGATRAVAVVMVLLGAWFLIEARSKTCTALLLMVPPLSYGSAWLARYARISPALTLTVFGFTLYGIYEFGVQSGIWDFHAVATALFGDPTLTQRTEIWEFAVRKIAERPWLGYGYEVFWGATVDSPSVREGPGFVAQMPHAHNGYLDLLLQTGIPGLVLVLLLVLGSLHVAGRVVRRSFGLGAFCLSILIFASLHNLLETTWFRSFSLKWMAVALVVSILSLDRSREDAR